MVQNRSSNPLMSFMRQPKVYITLPSQGQYYPQGSLDLPETQQLAVYSMTAKDELMLNVPDALLNGQAVVDVIQNCIPQIENAWEVLNIDIDVILLSIRIATYGEQMRTPVKTKEGVEFDYQVDLRLIIDSLLTNIYWDPIIPIHEDMTVYVRPLNYKQMTATSIRTFETQKIFQVVNNEDLTEEQKTQMFRESFSKLSEVTLNIMADSIYKIETSQGVVEDKEFIREFISNVDKEIFDKIQKHLESLKERNSIKPLIIETTEELREQGVTEDQITIPLTFDPSTFFV